MVMAKQPEPESDEDSGKVMPLRRMSGRRAATRQRLMDACAALIIRRGFKAVSMTSVAEEAGITRQTIYRYFSNSEGLIAATLVRAGREVLAAQTLILNRDGEPTELIVECIMTGLRLVRQDGLLRRAYESRDYPQAMLARALDDALIGRCVEAISPLARRVGWNEQEQYEAVEVIVRVVMSFLTIPSRFENDEVAMRDYLRRRVLPSLGLSPPESDRGGATPGPSGDPLS